MPPQKKKKGLAALATGGMDATGPEMGGGPSAPPAHVTIPPFDSDYYERQGRSILNGFENVDAIRQRTGKDPDINEPVQMAPVEPDSPHDLSSVRPMQGLQGLRMLKKRKRMF